MFQRLKPVELVSPLSRATCVERLRASIRSPWSFSTTGIVGRVGDEWLAIRCAISYRNSFQTILRGRFSEAPDGTHILCRFGMNRFVLAFMCVWFGGVLLIGGSIFLNSFIAMLGGQSLDKLPDTAGMIIPLAMVAFGIGLLKLCWYLARNERPEMIEFLKRNLEARDISGPVQQ